MTVTGSSLRGALLATTVPYVKSYTLSGVKKLIKTQKIFFCFLFFCLFLSACTDSDTFAPVTDISQSESIPKSGMYRVAKGETLYEISWRFGLDYRTLATWNNIKPPFTIQKNQLISLRKNVSIARVTHIPVQKIQREESEPNYSASHWIWPAHGKVIKGFSAFNKGINIASQKGEAIFAAASGKVVYSGNGLRGYGNLIIIKHNNLYLSAYAHCNRVLVKDGDWVKQGQKIAEMGSTGTDKIMLHFEIRRAGKPVNPLKEIKIL